MRVLPIVFLLFSVNVFAQGSLIFKDGTKAKRENLHKHLLNNTIAKNLALPLSDSTEDNWQDAFYAIALLQSNDPKIDRKIHEAVNEIQNRSVYFQRALLEILYDRYPGLYLKEVKKIFNSASDPKLFAMCGEYLLRSTKTIAERNQLLIFAKKKAAESLAGPHLEQLIYSIANAGKAKVVPSLHTLLTKNYLKGNVLMISFQRTNRNYPGLVMVRDSIGNFIKTESGDFFSVSQLARSIYNLPGYITNGNTPEGILRMDGFETSRLSMIGPTPNVQLTLPMEYHAHHFYRDSTLPDSIGNLSQYKKLLPSNFRNYFPIQQSFYAGKAGRTEIIAHGTTVDPSYYTGLPYYPFTPTMGCLCTIELWSPEDGKRVKSDQQLLADAITAAGGPSGYAIVININDEKKPVSLDDILPYLKLAGQE